MAISVMIKPASSACNLRCEYCFAAKGDFGTGRELMSFETAKKAIDFLDSPKKSFLKLSLKSNNMYFNL